MYYLKSSLIQYIEQKHRPASQEFTWQQVLNAIDQLGLVYHGFTVTDPLQPTNDPFNLGVATKVVYFEPSVVPFDNRVSYNPHLGAICGHPLDTLIVSQLGMEIQYSPRFEEETKFENDRAVYLDAPWVKVLDQVGVENPMRLASEMRPLVQLFLREIAPIASALGLEARPDMTMFASYISAAGSMPQELQKFYDGLVSRDLVVLSTTDTTTDKS